MERVFKRKLRKVRLRCSANLLLRHTGCILSIAGAIAVLVVLAERLLALSVITPWTFWVFWGVAAGAIILIWLLKQPNKMQVSLLLDERLGLKERFSTVLSLSGSGDPFAEAACDEARGAAERADLRGRFPIRPCRSWIYAAGVWVTAAALVIFLPQKDLLGFLRKEQQQQQLTQQVEQARVEVRQAADSVKLAVKQLGDDQLTEALSKIEQAPPDANPEDIKRQAIRTFGDLSEQIKKLQSGSQAEAMNLMQQMLKQLPGSADTLSQTLRQALAKGDFSQASSILNQLQKQLAQGELSDQQRKAQAEQLQELAKQLQELAQKNDALQKEMEKLGLDKSLAKLNDKQLREALQKLGLDAGKIEELMEKTAACRLASGRCAALGKALAGGAGASGLSADELEAAIEQLDELEAIKQQLMLAQMSIDEIRRAIAGLGKGMCEGLGGQGPFMEGLSDRSGPGSGGPGMGYGAVETASSGETTTQKTRVLNKPGEGPVIASWYFKDSQVKGEARRDLTEVIETSRDGAAEAISENQIPRKYEEAIKKYFGQLESAAPSSRGGK
jgi:hypothetical protein